MTTNARSGHTGGSLGCIDILATLYAKVVSQTNDPVVVSNGHVSPAVYALLAELGAISKNDLLQNFRQHNSIYEGHVSRHVPGVWYSTGPLGTGVSAATGFALAKKLRNEPGHVFALLGDGEANEGQVYEMMHVAKKYELDNLTILLDRNGVQLSGGTERILPVQIESHFAAAEWRVLYADGHSPKDIWHALSAPKRPGFPTLISCATVMGKGVSFMEKEGRLFHATWHGKALSVEEAKQALQELSLTPAEASSLDAWKKTQHFSPPAPTFKKVLEPTAIEPGAPRVYGPETTTDCRTAYGVALLDLATKNSQVVALTADLADSVKTSFVEKQLPKQHIDCGVAEQHMVSMAGGLSLSGFTPFVSTFGVFMTSRAKDQARVNDINGTNVKMVATHCGLSVGEDGTTHQAIDDMGSMLGLLNTLVMEPVDPNHTDRIIRYAANHYGNMYIRMGRQKIPIITKEDGMPFYGADYEYTYGRCDLIREGADLTVVASGPMVLAALTAINTIKKMLPEKSIALVAVSSIKQFDDTLVQTLRKSEKIITVEDHNTHSGLGSAVGNIIADLGLTPKKFVKLGVDTYMRSATAEELYELAGLSPKQLANRFHELLS